MSYDSRELFIRVKNKYARTEADLQPHEIQFYKINVGPGGIILGGDINLGLNKLKFQNIMIKELYGDTLTVRNIDDTTYRKFLADELDAVSIIKFILDGGALRGPAGASYIYKIQSHDGSAYVDNIVLQGGYVKLYNARLDNDLDAQSNRIVNLGEPVNDNDAVRFIDLKNATVFNQHDETANRALNTEYQNTSGKIMFIVAVVKFSGATSTDLCEVNGFVYPTSGSAEFVAKQSAYYGNTTYDLYVTLTLVVPPGYYYKIDAVPRGGSTASIYKWHEYY